MFDLVHGLSHAGPKPTTKAIASRFVWPSFKSDVKEWCRTCIDCQKAKVATHVSAPLMRREPPDRRFGSLHLDLVGPLPESRGMRYLMTIVDRFSRWMEAIPIPDISAETCVRAFLLHWVVRYGVPGDVVADRGTQFTSSLWRKLHELLGIKHSNTTAYHPAANGLVERLHRQVKAALMAREEKADWMEHLPMVLLGVRTAWRAELDASPAELTFGVSLHLPGEFVEETDKSYSEHDLLRNLQKQMNDLKPVQTTDHATRRQGHVPLALDSATHVFVRRDAKAPPLTRPYTGPFKVIAKLSLIHISEPTRQEASRMPSSA